MRDKVGLLGQIFSACAICMIMIAIFFYVGEVPKIFNETSETAVLTSVQTYTQNLAGVAMVISTHIGFSATLYVVLMVPLDSAIMTREIANKMYSPTAYYFGKLLSTALVQIPIPVCIVLMMFWTLGIETTS